MNTIFMIMKKEEKRYKRNSLYIDKKMRQIHALPYFYHKRI